MSEKEQDAAIGQLVREHGSAKCQLAALDTKLEQHAESLRSWSELALATARPGYTPSIGEKSDIPTREELELLIANRNDAFERLSRIQSRLRDAGAF